jgi:hypothetical protein
MAIDDFRLYGMSYKVTRAMKSVVPDAWPQRFLTST